MTTGMLHLHSILRYLVLIFALWAIVKSMSGMGGNKTFTKADQRPGKLFSIAMDIQFLVGIILYFMGSYGWNYVKELGMGEVMKNSVARFFVVEHPLCMFIALVLIHIGSGAAKKSNLSDQQKYKRSFWLYLIAFVLIFAAVPWPFRDELGRAWLPR